MKESRDYLELTFRSITCFSDDGKLDLAELNSLMAIALKDGHVDDNEKRVLGNIFSRLKEVDLDEAMQARVEEIKDTYGIE